MNNHSLPVSTIVLPEQKRSISRRADTGVATAWSVFELWL
jgi:hypothetical protein